MSRTLHVHLAAAGLLALIATVMVVFWSFPKLLVYLLLIIVAVLAYGALYLILASWMDPKQAGQPAQTAPAPEREGTSKKRARTTKAATKRKTPRRRPKPASETVEPEPDS